MRIKRLKLSGFKSFVEPAELRIEPGLTGVVGPNGCGKSNLLEAIRWVMGENSPKSLRSGGMDDVIFAGTSQRPARDFAEVVLHGEDDAGEELEVTRRIDRGAGSAYRVNGSDVRAKDVSLTFADAATGAHSPALVSQGKIAQVIAAKPAERRQMLEEAAGIAGLHVRRRDAENKLRQTETNLARLEDLMAGLDSQIATLRRQAKQAERYKKLSAQIGKAEARLLFARWRDAAQAADAARSEAKSADAEVAAAQQAVDAAQAAQFQAANALTQAREIFADRRDDASAHGHRMANLASQLEAAEERLADLDRQKERLEADRGDADRMTQDAAAALARLEDELASSAGQLTQDEAQRPALTAALKEAQQSAQNAELALAKATADHAGVEAEWRVAEAEAEQVKQRMTRLDMEQARLTEAESGLATQDDLAAALMQAQERVKQAGATLTQLRTTLDADRARKDDLRSARDMAANALSTARAEHAGVEREASALQRDRNARDKARDKARAQRKIRPLALDEFRVKPGYERALAAVLGRDAKSPLGEAEGEGRFWTGGQTPSPVADNLAAHVTACPPQLAARLALVHVADLDDGRRLAPGEWLVTRDGALRRWDGFVARGEGGAEAARLEADNRLAELESKLPALVKAVSAAQALDSKTQAELSQLQQALVASERQIAEASDAERDALRALDQAEAHSERQAARIAELAEAKTELEERRMRAMADLAAAQEARENLPDPAAGRGILEAAQAQNDTARSAAQAAIGTLATHDQKLAVARERVNAQRSEITNWQARSGEASQRLADMARRFEEIAQDRAIIAAKPEGIIREIEQGDAVRERLGKELAQAETAMGAAQETTSNADRTLASSNEILATAREGRAGLAARADSEEARRSEMARISGERFQCPPPMLCSRFEFEVEDIGGAASEGEELERLNKSRERIGPVNLVAADELVRLETEHGANTAEQTELAEAVNRLRGSIGSLNREGRERLKAAFEQVNEHFERLFTQLFEGGKAHLALIDSDDVLEAGLEIYAQPPGKRLQSLTLLSGGEQALTAIALIFALFLTNPAPICVLDEVDAPLDDANIDRFCDLLVAMTRETDTRYLIVTHNAVTMSRMHRLFGVTMIERGVSRLVSVDLGAAEELLAVE